MSASQGIHRRVFLRAAALAAGTAAIVAASRVDAFAIDFLPAAPPVEALPAEPVTEPAENATPVETEVEPLLGPHPFREVIFSADGKLMATTAGLQGNVREFAVWDVGTWKKRCSHYARQNSRTLHFSPDGKQLTVGIRSGKLVTIDTTTGKPTERDYPGAKNTDRFALSPDGSLLAAANKTDFTIVIWDLATMKEKVTLKGHSSTVYGLAFSPDNRRLVSGSSKKGMIIWDVEKGEAKHKPAVAGSVQFLTVSKDGRLVASASNDGNIRTYSMSSGRRVHKTTGPTNGPQLLGQPERVAYSPDGKLLAFAGTGPIVAVFRLDRVEPKVDANEVLALIGRLDDDDFRVRQRAMAALAKLGYPAADALNKAHREATSIEAKRRLKSVIDSIVAPGPDQIFAGHTARIDGLTFSPDGQWLASGSHDKTLRIWDVATGKTVVTLSREEPESEFE